MMPKADPSQRDDTSDTLSLTPYMQHRSGVHLDSDRGSGHSHTNAFRMHHISVLVERRHDTRTNGSTDSDARMHTHVCMFACLHACIHPCIHPYIPISMHASMHLCIHASMNPCIHPPSMSSCVHLESELSNRLPPSQGSDFSPPASKPLKP